MAVVAGVESAFLYDIHRSKRTSPKHAHCVIRQIHGLARSLDVKLDDDVALAACQIRDMVPRIIGLAQYLQHWADVVNECEPHEAPDHGARLCKD